MIDLYQFTRMILLDSEADGVGLLALCYSMQMTLYYCPFFFLPNKSVAIVLGIKLSKISNRKGKCTVINLLEAIFFSFLFLTILLLLPFTFC